MFSHSQTIRICAAFMLTTLSLCAKQEPQQLFKQKDFKFYAAHTATSLLTLFSFHCFTEAHNKGQFTDLEIVCLAFPLIYNSYKVPQWTDSYILKNNIERSTKQNIIRWLTLACWPLSPCLADSYMDLKIKNK